MQTAPNYERTPSLHDGRQYQNLRRGWVLGSEEFRRELLEQTGKWLGPNHFGQERRETAEVRARRIIAETLRRERLTRENFELLSANHRIKVALARQLRQEATMELKWIAEEPGIGSWKYSSNLLKAEECTSKQCELGL